MKICLVSSCGGHLTELRRLLPAVCGHEYFYVLNDHVNLPPDMDKCTYFISHSERDLKFFINLWEAWCILRREKPKVILTTGAGPAVPFAVIGRVLFDCRVIYVETIASVQKPSLTGRLMYFLAHNFYYQWLTLAAWFPRGRYKGALL